MRQKDLYILSGADGFLGNNLIRLLNGQDPQADVRALSLPAADRRSLAGLRCQVLDCDVTAPATLAAAFDVPGNLYAHIYVIHAAGIIDISSRPNPRLQQVNVEGTRNMLRAAETLNAAGAAPVRFVEVSSVHAIPELPRGTAMTEVEHFDPDSVTGQYAKSKAAAAELVVEAAERGLDAVIVHPAGILGPHNYSPENMKELFRVVAGGRLRLSVPGGYNFADVRDIAAGILAACRQGRSGEKYILSGHYGTMQEIQNEVCRLTGRPPIQLLVPLALARMAAPVCETYYRVRGQVPLFTSYAVQTVKTNAEFSCAKAEHELGYKPRPLMETVADMLHWMQEQPDWRQK
ncbi:MAG: NAD-dependent epimerase/dehydratase family protein [Clostridia bacterium]|nr:NAD-dependent epimerase/dehydratase family protein [Clostridia bacterium]